MGEEPRYINKLLWRIQKVEEPEFFTFTLD